MFALACVVLGLASGCFNTASRSDRYTAPPDASETVATSQQEVETETTWAPTRRELAEIDAPEVSRSFGEPGGVIVMWPRIVGDVVPADTPALARALQEELEDLVRRTLPGRSIDVRPEPERVCPQAGCEATVVGILLAREEWGCAAVALISAPGRSAMRLVPWYGYVELESPQVAFREPPEDAVVIRDFGYCDEILGRLHEGDPAVEEVLRDVAE
jgi:hypothetical protein